MDKYTNRYIGEFFTHYKEEFRPNVMNYIENATCGDDFTYLSDAIQSEFTGPERDFLQMKLMEKKWRG